MSSIRVLIGICLLACLALVSAQEQVGEVSAIQLGSYQSMLSEAMSHATMLAEAEEAAQAAWTGENADITDVASLLSVGSESLITVNMDQDPTSALGSDMLSSISSIHRVADNVTASMQIPEHTYGGEASIHAVLARYAADAARRVGQSAKDFMTVSDAAKENALKYANQGPRVKRTNSTVSVAVAAANVAETKAAVADAQKNTDAAKSAAAAADAALKKDPTNKKLIAAAKKAKERLAKARHHLHKANKRALKAAKHHKHAKHGKHHKKHKKHHHKKHKKVVYKPLKAKKGLDLKKARRARRAISKIEARLAKLKKALLKDPKNKSLLAILETTKKEYARARAKMLKAFKRPPPLKKKPYKPAKYLKGDVRAECKKAGPAHWYLNRYPDLKKRYGHDKAGRAKAFRHFCTHGRLEGRESCFIASCEKFNPLSKHCKHNPAKWYLEFYDDLSAAFGNDLKAAEKHYRTHGHKEKRLNCFAPVKVKKFKKKKPPSAGTPKKRKAGKMTPLDEKEESDCKFDPTSFYLDNNEDIKNWAGPFLRIIGRYHWCVWGQREGRASCFDRKTDCTEWNAPAKQETCTKNPLEWYGRQNPDIYRWVGNNPEWWSAHFCRWGRHERRPHCFTNIEHMCKRWDPKQPRCAKNPLKWYNKEWPHMHQSYGHGKEGLRRTKEWFCHWGRGWGQDNCFKDPHKFCSPQYDPHSEECKANPTKWYLNAWWDLHHAFGNNLDRGHEHFCKWGQYEHRANCFPPKGPKRKAFCARWVPKSERCRANPAKWYLGAHPDLKKAFGTNEKAAIRHWCEYGKHERRANCFSKKAHVCEKYDPKSALCKRHPAKWYLNMYPDLKAAFGKDYHKARKHWLHHGHKEGRASCFKRHKRHHHHH